MCIKVPKNQQRPLYFIACIKHWHHNRKTKRQCQRFTAFTSKNVRWKAEFSSGQTHSNRLGVVISKTKSFKTCRAITAPSEASYNANQYSLSHTHTHTHTHTHNYCKLVKGMEEKEEQMTEQNHRKQHNSKDSRKRKIVREVAASEWEWLGVWGYNEVRGRTTPD